MKIRCLVIDDKPLAIDLLVSYIAKIPFLELVNTQTDPLQGLEMIRTQPIDLVFLDIQMPHLSGIDFLKLAGNNVKTIFTTAYVKYAMDGYDLNVVDYLLKPIAFDRFYQAAEKALNSIQSNSPLPYQSIDTQSSNSYLFVKAEHKIHKINLAELLYVESLENYVCLQTVQERILSLQTLKRMEEQLPSTAFIRVHRSYMISVQHISYIERSAIVMQNGFSVPIGNSYRETFFKIVNSKGFSSNL